MYLVNICIPNAPPHNKGCPFIYCKRWRYVDRPILFLKSRIKRILVLVKDKTCFLYIFMQNHTPSPSSLWTRSNLEYGWACLPPRDCWKTLKKTALWGRVELTVSQSFHPSPSTSSKIGKTALFFVSHLVNACTQSRPYEYQTILVVNAYCSRKFSRNGTLQYIIYQLTTWWS